MAMGTRKKRERQQSLWIPTSQVVAPPRHVFYDQLNAILDQHKFDARVEHLCRRFYKKSALGRPSLPPGVYFRALLLGYFEGIDSERGIAWRLADSLSLRRFLGYALDELTPDHSTLSRTRRLYELETHKAVFRWVIKLLVGERLVQGQSVAIDGTTLEANAALKSIVRRDNGQRYDEYLKDLAQAAGIEDPTREQLARFDRKRKKKGSNQDWQSPSDPDARITMMKRGSTHLAHKVEHAVDLTSGALLAITLQAASEGDTKTVLETLADAQSRGAGLPRAGHRRTRGRQGVSQRRGAGPSADRRSAQLHSRAGTGPAAVAGRRKSGRAETSVRESAARARRSEQAAAEVAEREGGAQLCTPVRDGRDAAGASARSKQHSEAAAGAGRGVQPVADSAQNARRGQAAAVARAFLWSARLLGSFWWPWMPFWTRRRVGRLSCRRTALSANSAFPIVQFTPSAENRQFYHGLLGGLLRLLSNSSRYTNVQLRFRVYSNRCRMFQLL